jgi:hypothetical protein
VAVAEFISRCDLCGCVLPLAECVHILSRSRCWAVALISAAVAATGSLGVCVLLCQ